MGQSESSSFSDVQTNTDLQELCYGCREIELRIEAGLERQRQGHAEFEFRPFVFHMSFHELNECARQCVACRIFRQALLLRHSSESLLGVDNANGEVRAVVRKNATSGQWKPKLDFFPLEIFVGPHDSHRSARVACLGSSAVESLSLSSSPFHASIIQQARKWLRVCKDDHVECANLRWSSRNPTRLLRILADSEVQLVQTFPESTPFLYAALSYCWGGSRIGITTKSNHPRRAWPFSCEEFPRTIQDAIVLVRRLGVEYIWIDAVCIVQDDAEDWRREAALMHEVYGNAFFTLCAVSNKTATERLLKPRDAWKYPTECRLAGHWLANFDISLDEIRAQSTLADRAWTLQEERLSPRLLYWSTQRMYWSCSSSQLAEESPAQESYAGTLHRHFHDERLTAQSAADPAQRFLGLCRTGAEVDLHEAWLDLIKSYLRRDLTVKSDRFSSLAGLASRYHQAQQGDRYLAGLWAKSFSKDLVWSVVQPCRQGAEDLKDLAPSWSWASLPLRTEVVLKYPSLKTSVFQYHSCSPPVDTEDRSGGDWSATNKAIQHGTMVKSVTIEGRLRQLVHPHSKLRPYSELSKIVAGVEYLSFSDKPEQPVHSVDLARGRLVAYEAQKEEVVCQLDYLEDAQRFADGELEIHCLEVGTSAMLLLESDEPREGFRRVGVCHGFWEGFFSSAEMTVLELI